MTPCSANPSSSFEFALWAIPHECKTSLAVSLRSLPGHILVAVLASNHSLGALLKVLIEFLSTLQIVSLAVLALILQAF